MRKKRTKKKMIESDSLRSCFWKPTQHSLKRNAVLSCPWRRCLCLCSTTKTKWFECVCLSVLRQHGVDKAYTHSLLLHCFALFFEK